ncbi:MAG: YdhR family protein [Anaerolineae bacterium]|nr:YdhR family protein [Anaerolineae bacterium]
MLPTILQINFKFNGSKADFQATAHPAAQPIAAFPGLQWKIWLFNENGGEAGGIYLFDSPEAAQHYLQSPIITGLGKHPGITAITAKLFESPEDLSRITRAPLGLAQSV